jgi:hypothetical protein
MLVMSLPSAGVLCGTVLQHTHCYCTVYILMLIDNKECMWSVSREAGWCLAWYCAACSRLGIVWPSGYSLPVDGCVYKP